MMSRKACQLKKISLSQLPFGNLVSLVHSFYFLQTKRYYHPIIKNSGKLKNQTRYHKIINDILYHSTLPFIYANKNFRLRSPLKGLYKAVSLHLHRAEKSKNNPLKVMVHTCC